MTINDQDKSPPYHINATSSRQVMRIKKNIKKGFSSGSITKFSELTSEELYGRQKGESFMIPGCEIVKNLLTKKTTITECKKYMLFENIIVIHQVENVNLSIHFFKLNTFL